MSIESLASEPIYRLLVAMGILLASVILYRAINSLTLRRARLRVSGLERNRPGVPVLLYFTTPTCAPCKTVQRPAIQRLQERIGERLEVVEVDASSQPELASQWGVLSVPTTFIIDAQGNPRYVNHGVAPLDKLQRQFAEIISRES
jgi:thioredoxin-like negative regulator of GroEL